MALVSCLYCYVAAPATCQLELLRGVVQDLGGPSGIWRMRYGFSRKYRTGVAHSLSPSFTCSLFYYLFSPPLFLSMSLSCPFTLPLCVPLSLSFSLSCFRRRADVMAQVVCLWKACLTCFSEPFWLKCCGGYLLVSNTATQLPFIQTYCSFPMTVFHRNVHLSSPSNYLLCLPSV